MIGDVFNRIMGNVNVDQTHKRIIISGAPGRTITRDLDTLMKTSVISKYMFTAVTNNRLEIPLFFAMELDYLLRAMIEAKKNVYSSKATLQACLNELREKTWLADIEQGEDIPLNLGNLKRINKELLPHQKRFLAWYAHTKNRYGLRGMLLAAAPGAGKAQPLYSKIKVPGGWSTMGEMQIGTVVSTPDGGTASVVGVFPQGVKDIYEVTFKDGRSTRACGEHLWQYFDARKKKSEERWYVTNTLKIKQDLENPNHDRCYVPLVRSDMVSPDIDLPMDPYLLGVLLGDGGLRWNVVLSSVDNEIIEQVRSLLPADTKIARVKEGSCDYRITTTVHGRNNLRTILNDLGLMGKLSFEKSIPEMFMHGSHSQRLHLLQGLMDTDGTVDNHSSCSFTSTSEELAKNVQYLVRSLGGNARISTKIPTYTYNGELLTGRIAYTVNIRYHTPSELFRLTRKKLRCNDMGQYASKLKNRVKSITYVGQEEAQCIMIDSKDHLYITDDFIVTHNTISGISVAEVTGADNVIVIAPNNAVENVWAKTLANDMTVDTPHWVSRNRDKVPVPKNCKYFLFHYEDLPTAIIMVNRGIIKGKICVILDESHNFNDPKSQRTQRFETLCKLSKSQDIVYSSGTPIKAMGADMVPLLRVLDPLFTEEVEARFKRIYGKNAAKANDMLANRLAVISYKVPKSEFMIDKPIEIPVPIKIANGEYYTLDAIKVRMQEYINQRVKFYKEHEAEYTETYFRCLKVAEPLFTKEQKIDYKEYQEYISFFRKYGFDSRTDGPKALFCNKFEKEAVNPVLSNEDKKLFKDAKSVYKYVGLKIRGECLGNVLGRERIAANVEIARVLNYPEFIDNAEKKTIFFSSHTEVVNEVIARTNKLGYRPLMVTAETNHMLKQIVQKFDTDPKANPLAATYQSLSTAVPMTAANVIVAMNTPFRIHEMEQAIARSWRLGQDKTVYVYFCTLDTGDKTNITTRSADIMSWSKEQVDQIMGYSSRDDLILDELGMEGFSCEEYHQPVIVNELQNDSMVYQAEINKFHDINDSISQTVYTDVPGELGPDAVVTTQNNQQVDSTMEGFI